jgi:hypothetical protein
MYIVCKSSSQNTLSMFSLSCCVPVVSHGVVEEFLLLWLTRLYTITFLNGQNFHKKLKTNKDFYWTWLCEWHSFSWGSVLLNFLSLCCVFVCFLPLFCVLCPMLAMSQNCPFLIAPLIIFSNVYLRARSGDIKN